MVGMGAMVGGGTGAVMTAVTMTFEMTLDYGIVMPMILAVATSVGVRRMLSRENIYTLKLARRGRTIPKARHSNMFLVRPAREVMDPDVLILPADTDFDGFLHQHAAEGRLRHVVVTNGNRIMGVIRVNTGIRRGLEGTHTGILLADVANRHFIIVDEDVIVSDVIERMWRKEAFMAIVVRARERGLPRAGDVLGVITKEHVADSVAETLTIYPRTSGHKRGRRRQRSKASDAKNVSAELPDAHGAWPSF
jgi:CIC family chloride channel protein